MRDTTKIKKLAEEIRDRVNEIVVVAQKMDSRTGTVDPTRKKKKKATQLPLIGDNT